MKARQISMIFAVLFVAACAKAPIAEPEVEQEISEYTHHDEGVWFNFLNVTSGDEQSKALREIPDGGLDFAWLNGDCISIWSNEGGMMTAELTPNGEQASATFTGSGFSLTEGATYYSFFPSIGSIPNETVSREAIPFNFADQTLSGVDSDGFITNFKTHDFNWATATCVNGSANFDFRHIPAFIKMELTLPEKVNNISSVTIGTAENVFTESGTFRITYLDGSDTPVGWINDEGRVLSNTIVLNAPNSVFTIGEDRKLVAWFALAPVDLSNRVIYIVANDGNEKRYSVSFTAGNLNLEAGYFYSNLFKRTLVENAEGSLKTALQTGGTVFASNCTNDLEENTPIALLKSVNLVVDTDLTIPTNSIEVGDKVVFTIIGDDKPLTTSEDTKADLGTGREARLTIKNGGIVNKAGAVSIDGAEVVVDIAENDGKEGCAIKNERNVTILRGNVKSEKSNIVLNVGNLYKQKVTIENGEVWAKLDVVRNEENTVSAAKINGGTVTAGEAVIYNKSSHADNSVEVFGGMVVLTSNEAKVVENAAGVTNLLKAEAVGGQFQQGEKILTTIKEIKAAGINVPEGYTTNPDGTIAPPAEENCVAKIGEKKYITLAEAVEAVKSNETVTLIKDVELSDPVVTDKTFTLTLNANITPKAISYTSHDNTRDALVIVKRGGNLTINGTGKISSTNENVYAAVKMTQNGEAETGDAAKLTVDGTVTLEGYYYGIVGNGSRHNTEITVNGGTIKGYNDTDCQGILHPQDGKLTINGGEISGYNSAVELRGGTLEINGGTLTSTASPLEVDPNGSGSTTKGAALAIAQHNTKKDINVTVSGGTFNGYKAISVTNPQNNDTDNVNVTYKAGTLNGGITLGHGTFNLAGNLEVIEPVMVIGKTTLDLGSATLKANFTDTKNNKYAPVIVSRGGDLTIEGNDGKINSGEAYAGVQMINPKDTGDAEAKLTVNSGTIEGQYYGIVGNGNRHNTEIIINDGTVKGLATNDNAGIFHPQNGTLTINGGTIEGATGIYVKSGSVSTSISAGTIKGIGVKADYVTTGDGFKQTGDAIVFDNCDYPGGAPNASIEGGKFFSINANAVGSYAKTGKEPITGFISGGLFSTEPAADLIVAGKAAVENTDDATKTDYPWTIGECSNVAKIGTTEYATLAEAVAAVPTNGTQTTITMIANHEILGNAGVTIAKNQNVVLDLAGFTVKNLVNESKASQVIKNEGTLKITGNGTLTNALANGVVPGDWPTYNYTTNIITNHCGTLTIENGTFTNTQNSGITYALDNNSNGNVATATINGGTFKSVGNSAVRMFCNSTTAANTLTINNGYFEGNYYAVSVSNASGATKVGILNVNGGEFESTASEYNACIANWVSNKSSNIKVNISAGKFNDYVLIASNASITGGLFKYKEYTDPDDGTKYELAKYVAAGYAVVENTDASTKDAYPWTIGESQGVAKIGDTVYATLAEAVAAVPTDDTQTTITMIGDDYYEVNNPITINANLNVILDLNGRTVSAVAPSGNGSALITNKGTLTINDSGSEGKLRMMAQSPDGRAIPGYASNTITNNGTLVVNGGIVQNETTSNNGQACYPIDNVSNGNLYSPKVEINGGRFITKSNAALRLFCNSTTNNNKAKINGGYFEAVYFAIQIRSANDNANEGAVEITNGEFEATADSYNCSIACRDGNTEAVSLIITGGKFNDNIVSKAGNNKISGGYFKCLEYTYPGDSPEYKLSDYLAEGATCSKDLNADGYYVVTSNN